MREPPARLAELGPRRAPAEIVPVLRHAARGCVDAAWDPPCWLMKHQVDAARRVAGAVTVFHGALLADAVGMGKTYVALALATRYDGCTVVVPATLVSQWRRVSERLDVPVTIVSHEALSRGARIDSADLVVVDEAHRFRNPATKRYDALARGAAASAVLLVTATPVVNRSADLVHVLRLFLGDQALAVFGVPSLERAAAADDRDALVHAAAPLIVARSSRTAGGIGPIPATTDSRIIRAACVEAHELPGALARLDALRFPSFGHEAGGLLRLHLFSRFASSTVACRETLVRHRAYLERARAAAERGETLPRGVARALFGDIGGSQLDLDLGGGNGERVQADRLVPEMRAVANAIDSLDASRGSPKLRELRAVLQDGAHRKLVVFTTATATALALGRALDWKGIAVVTGRGARIASGRISTDEAFDLFAPHARRRPPPGPGTAVRVLIATDLASEGLDLQDADAVVHFDLPWTPLRLEQRQGRVARLGSLHATAHVVWFAPPPELERRLELGERIGEKATTQLRLAASSATRVGRAHVAGGRLEARESDPEPATPGRPGFAVIRDALPGLCALAWSAGGHSVGELVSLDGTAVPCLDGLDGVEPSGAAVPAGTLRAVRDLARGRLSSAARGPGHATARAQITSILAAARRAGHERRIRLVALLDAALDRVHGGLAAGAERELLDALGAPRLSDALAAWLRRTPDRRVTWTGPVLRGLIVGANGEAEAS